jgi:hypothetical protein
MPTHAATGPSACDHRAFEPAQEVYNRYLQAVATGDEFAAVQLLLNAHVQSQYHPERWLQSILDVRRPTLPASDDAMACEQSAQLA